MEHQEEIQSSFDRSAAIVRKLFRYSEQEYARPAIRLLSESSRNRPIFSTLMAVFSTLSLLPVLSFLGLTLFVFASCTFLSLAGGLAIATAIVLLSGILLMGTLAFLFFFALSLTACATSVYLLLRLALLASNDGPLIGLSEWIQETKSSLLGIGREVTVFELREENVEDDAHSVSETLIFDQMPVGPSVAENVDEMKVEKPESEAGAQDVFVVVKDEAD